MAFSSTPTNNAEPYLRRGLHTVDGWLQPGAARLVVKVAEIQVQSCVRGSVAEIGVHEGRFFILLCLLRGEDEDAVAIDVFEQRHLNRDSSGRGNRERLERNLRRYVSSGKRPIMISADSRSISPSDVIASAGSRFRLFSIDGGHQAETVYHDLELAAGALCDGGVIVLDDYFNEGWPGVADGTNRFFSTGNPPKLGAFAIVQNKVLISQHAHAEKYRKALTEAVKDNARIRESTLFGDPISYFDFRLSQGELRLMRAFRAGVYRYHGFLRLLRGVGDSL